ncbi:MAG: helix-turn-helix domain-containing protein [Clostridia bacterium]|nr:helix-turn-helix domain-containing protein [Clostridia bacterium]
MRIYTTKEMMKEGGRFHLLQFTTQKTEPIHTHDFIELVYILSGEVTHEIDGERYPLKRGDILFMNVGCTHAFSSSVEYCYVNILFTPQVLTNPHIFLALTAFNELCHDAPFGKLSFYGQERAEAEAIIQGMLTEFKEKKNHWEEMVGNRLHILLLMMLRKTELGVAEGELSDMWQKIAEYIDRNLDQRLTLSSLAEQWYYNPSYFSRCFKEQFGMTLTEYITRKRLEHAKQLLTATTLSLDEISEQTGFADRAALAHAFSKYLGMPPKEFRKK